MAVVLHPQRVIHPPRTIPQKVCVGMGWAFILLGTLGFIIPGLMGMHLGVAHNAIHLLSGILAIMAGISDQEAAPYQFSIGFGTVYGLLGVAGLILSRDGLLTVIPNGLEFGINDHVIHLMIAAIFLVPALFWRSQQINP